jgi:hypothetical protein
MPASCPAFPIPGSPWGTPQQEPRTPEVVRAIPGTAEGIPCIGREVPFIEERLRYRSNQQENEGSPAGFRIKIPEKGEIKGIQQIHLLIYKYFLIVKTYAGRVFPMISGNHRF